MSLQSLPFGWASCLLLPGDKCKSVKSGQQSLLSSAPQTCSLVTCCPWCSTTANYQGLRMSLALSPVLLQLLLLLTKL